MTIRHVVVEGPDGAGKSTLVDYMTNHSYFIPARKASASKEGPIANLAQWCEQEETVWRGVAARGGKTHWVYDRHPVISEPIYGAIVRGYTQPGFQDPHGWLNVRRLNMYQHTLVVWCLPPLFRILEHVSTDRDMPGVAENIATIREAYVKARRAWNGLGLWVNPFVTDPADIVSSIDLMIQNAAR
jgi:hypothetical protein